MTHDDTEIIGKSVKDIYGSYVGKIVGTITEIDGSIQSVGVDCGSNGLQMIPDEHLVVQGDVVIFIPKWRLDSQRLIRENQLTLRRLRAMVEIVAGNDEMRVDAEILEERYRTKLDSLQKMMADLKATLDARLAELEDQSRSAKMLFFDAKIQYKSNEIQESTFESVKLATGGLIENASHETAEISNIKERIRGLETEIREVNDLVKSGEGITAGGAAQPHAEQLAASPEPMQAVLPETPRGGFAEHAIMPDEVAIGAATAATTPPSPGGPGMASPDGAPGTLKQAAGSHDEEQSSSPGTSNMQDAFSSANLNAGAAAAAGADGAATVPDRNVPREDVAAPPPAEAEAADSPYAPGPGAPESAEPPASAEFAFPEPPRNTAVRDTQTSPKNDDDWLSRMESQ
ncbi:MAG: CdvA-like protein [Nitrosopumilaceae archaeon]|nr:CdvA-like protein [Nitrosopumilaceae archaeon]